MMRYCLFFLISAFFSTAVSNAQQVLPDPMAKLPTRNVQVWYRYYAAGEQALKQNKPKQAKSYFLSSLTALENENPKEAVKDMMLLVRMSALEDRIEHLYAQSPQTNDERELAFKKEKAEALKRIATVNTRFAQHSEDPFALTAQRNSRKADEDYQKLQAKIQESSDK